MYLSVKALSSNPRTENKKESKSVRVFLSEACIRDGVHGEKSASKIHLLETKIALERKCLFIGK